MLHRFFIVVLFFAAGEVGAATYRPLQHLERGFSDLPSTRNAVIFGVGTAATLGALAIDEQVRDYFKRHEPLGGVAKIGNVAGNGLPTTVLAFGLLGYGLLNQADREANAGLAMLEAFLVDFAATHVLKFTVRRERPDGSSNTSFPSGHASRTFSTAGTLLAIYGPGVGVPMLGVGAFVSASRIAVDKHWLSDTIFGATLGFISGYTFALHHRGVEAGGIEEPKISLSVTPSGATVALRF